MSNEELLARIDERQIALNEKLDAILAQAIKTNGRVSISERDIKELQMWRAESRGHWKGVAAISTTIGALIGFFLNLIK
jgi:hypothetical protein